MHIGIGLIIAHLKSIIIIGSIMDTYKELKSTRSHEIHGEDFHGAKLHGHKYTELINTEPNP